MYRSLKSVQGNHLNARDGALGAVNDFYFDDQSWTVRYVVADTGNWLPGRKVLISPSALGQADWASRMIPVALTKTQIKESPSIETDRPVSRQEEEALSSYYDWPMYWNASAMAANVGYAKSPAPVVKPSEKTAGEHNDNHLRGYNEVVGYHVRARDGKIGHVEDMVIKEEDWAVSYIVVDTRDWWPGRKVLMLPMWVMGISWDTSTVQFDLPKTVIAEGPEYDPAAPINQQYEKQMFDYYGRPAGVGP